jgi:DNA-binding Xre family transcriptional regulator
MTLTSAVKNRIKELLAERNISLYRLERIGGISPNTANSIMAERNKSLNFKIIMQFIQAFDMKPHEFFNSPFFEDPDLDID